MGRFLSRAATLLAVCLGLLMTNPMTVCAGGPALADTLEDVRRLEALADEWAGEHPGADPVELTVNFLCAERYDDPLWSLVLGGANADFDAHVQQREPALAELRGLTDVTLPTGETVDFVHLTAVAGAGYGYGIPQVVCSWGGDCIQLAASARGHSDDAAACYEALAVSFAAVDGTGWFPLSDWLADLDGVILGQRLLAGERLSSAMEDYYAALTDAPDPNALRAEQFTALQFGAADTGDTETFRTLVQDTFFQDAGVQLYLLANEYAVVDDAGQTAVVSDMQAPLEAACMLTADRLADMLGGAAVEPPAPTPAPDDQSAAVGQTPPPSTSDPAPESSAAGLWDTIRQAPDLLLAATGVLALAFLAVLMMLWWLRRR